jgi:hypothetical protein
VKVPTGFSQSRKGSNGGFCEHGNEYLGFLKRRNFLDRMSNISVSGKTLNHAISELMSICECDAKKNI